MDSGAIKPDRFYESLAWLHVNRKKVVIAVAGVAVVTAVVAFLNWNKRRQQEVANETLSEIKLLVGPNAPIPAGAVEALQKLANTYADTGAGARALLLAAATLYDQEKFSEA